MSFSNFKTKWSDFSLNRKLVVILTLVTTVMHVLFSPVWFGTTVNLLNLDLGLLFIVNAIGYVVFLIAGYFLDLDENIAQISRILLLVWTVGTIAGWILYHPGDTLLDSSIMNKVVEGLLVVFWVLDFMNSR
ncbi:MAG: hypothetical protein ACW981_19720 [Candidatus Hodarchaeales archaeon]|jgi:hypothetical protein